LVPAPGQHGGRADPVSNGRQLQGLPYESARDSLALYTKNEAGQTSPTCLLPLQYTNIGGMGRAPTKYGFVNLIPASTDMEAHAKPWLELAHSGEQLTKGHAEFDMRKMNEGTVKRGPGPAPAQSTMFGREMKMFFSVIQPPRRSNFPKYPENIRVYGYSPKGKLVTCVVGRGSIHYTSVVEHDGRFSILIPYQALRSERELIINITDRHNGLISSTRSEVPAWTPRS